MNEKAIKTGLLTISDRAAEGIREDVSGLVLREIVGNRGMQVVLQSIVSDDPEEIQTTLRKWADSGDVDLVLTTGGTGFSSRDRAPEATRAVIERETPGLSEAMRSASLQITPHAMLSRGISGIRGRVLIVNLPGSPKAVKENLRVLLPVLPHAVDLLRDDPRSESGHPFPKANRT
jgi:molybdenum cofactor synthesis domain-containing protein